MSRMNISENTTNVTDPDLNSEPIAELEGNARIDYSFILERHQLSYDPSEYYWQVGEITGTQGWIIHLSVIQCQLYDLLIAVIPELVQLGIPFKIVRDIWTAGFLLEGAFGYINLGKLVSIYPAGEKEVNELVVKLIDLTIGMRGPNIPTDRWLGGCVYTRYGSFNPVITYASNGVTIKNIYDVYGNLMPDPYTVPFSLPTGVSWPFGDITPPDGPKASKLLNSKYYPFVNLKPDVKGDVIKALYFRKPWQISVCLIKQGRKNMLADEAGQDIHDRLCWQYDLHRQLSGIVPLPKVIDFFQQDGDSYLAMEFIKGVNLTQWLYKKYQDSGWHDINTGLRLQLVDNLIDILAIIGRYHEQGLIHRDINPENFLIDREGRLYLIDIELSWSTTTGRPYPPFKLGSPGFMSLEQFNGELPAIGQDIFALGALMLAFFTNVHPAKILGQSKQELEAMMLFLTGDEGLSSVVPSCFSADPDLRPSLAELQNPLLEFRRRIALNGGSRNEVNGLQRKSSTDLRNTIEDGLRGLAHPKLLSPKCRWLSKIANVEGHIANEQLEMDLYTGWHTGMAGPLWLVGSAKRCGFDIECCMTAYRGSWEYLQKHCFEDSTEDLVGLYKGKEGVALAIIEGMRSGLLNIVPEQIAQLESCFFRPAISLDLAVGIAGQGLALLQGIDFIVDELANTLLTTYVNRLIDLQEQDGLWTTGAKGPKEGERIYGLDRGIAGILLFLLQYLQRHSDGQLSVAVTRGLYALIKIAKRDGQSYVWTTNNRNKNVDRWTTGYGMPGIALVFVKAYEVLKDPQYRKLAEGVLRGIPSRPVRMDYTLGAGMAGLGEVCLEAARILGDAEWQDRSHWIAQLLAHCFQRHAKDTVYWMVDTTMTSTADLFTGNSGVLHFLMRYLFPEKMGHPLLPYSIIKR